jgi:heat shock protein HtpX
MAKNIYENIEANKIRTILLVFLFPIVLTGLITGALFGFGLFMNQTPSSQQGYYEMINQTLPYLIVFFMIFALVWLSISYFAGAKMILRAAHAVDVMKFDNGRQIHKIVENVAITAGLPCPQVYIIDDDSLNAFATGRNPERASITLTTGIIAKLEKTELEAVIAHEMSHIGNRDIRLMLLMVAGIGFCAFVGQLLLRGSFTGRRGGNNKSGGVVLALGAAFMVFGYIIAPLLRLAVSRRREYQADATACLLTRNPLALASALRKISEDSRVEVLDSQTSVSAMCIANPLKNKMSLFGKLSGITATHPPIAERIAKLEAMGR